MAERNYLKTEAVFLTEKTPKKEVVVTPPLREDSLTVTENGTYQAPIGRGYTDVEVNVQELPEVTSADNGKVLKVEDGEWGKGDAITLVETDGPTGDDFFIVNMAYDIFIQKLKTSTVCLHWNGITENEFRTIISYKDATHTVTFCGDHTDTGIEGILVYYVAPDSSDNTKTQLSFVKFSTLTRRITLTTSSLLAIQSAYSNFMQQALQNAGQITQYSEIHNNEYISSDVFKIASMMNLGLICEYEVTGITIRPSSYVFNENTSFADIDSHIDIPTLDIGNNVRVCGWIGMSLTTTSILIVGAIIPIQ